MTQAVEEKFAKIRQCKLCNKSFVAATYNNTYCSIECRDKNAKKIHNPSSLITKNCHVCGFEFKANKTRTRCNNCITQNYTAKCVSCGKLFQSNNASRTSTCMFCRHIANLQLHDKSPNDCQCYLCMEKIKNEKEN